MSVPCTAAWPPPPDLASIRELVRDADIEGFIGCEGAPEDEYDPEAEAIFSAIAHFKTEQITPDALSPILEAVWRQNHVNDDAELAQRRPALRGLAEQIARFFGPEAKPQVRS